MTKEQFMEQVASEIRQHYMETDLDITCGTYMKNNDTARHGIVMKRRDEFISPTIYVDEFYQDYLRKKKTIPEIAEEILTICGRVNKHAEQYRDFSVEFDDCREKIIYRLISYEKNRSFLQKVPYLPFLDLAVVFSIVCNVSEQGLETITITNELIEHWQTSTQKLVQLAEKNTPRLLPPTVNSLVSVLAQYLGIPEKGNDNDNEEEAAGFPMLLLSNVSGVNGASVLLYPNVIHQLASKYHSNLHILPSSIHEIIVVPDENTGTTQELSQMVKEINKNHVCREEVLSDTAYYYDCEQKRFLY